MSGYAAMKSASTGSTGALSAGRLTRSRPLGACALRDSSCSASSISASTRRHRSRKRAPSAVSAMLRVLRWNRRTFRRASSRAIRLPTADADTPSARAAATKLRVSATCTKTTNPLRLSIRPLPFGFRLAFDYGLRCPQCQELYPSFSSFAGCLP
ncbi:hypothetical protein Y030_3943 [Burkholderia pseudomallei MSHR332]|nr:hypothetical protein Y030_3943 [Burkholderia pseudomallei MSHR332]